MQKKGNLIRTIEMDGENYYCLSDLSKIIGVNSLYRQAGGTGGVVKVSTETSGGFQDISYISESSMIKVILSSRKVPDDLKREILEKSKIGTKVMKAISNFDFSEVPENMYLYVIEESITGNIKIGISSNPERRLAQLQVGNSSDLNLIYVKKSENALVEERYHHIANYKSLVRGEWFTPEAKKYLIS